MYSLIFVFFIAVLLYVKHKLQYKRRDDIALKIPGPEPLPFIGNALYFSCEVDPLSILLDLFDKYGNIFRLWLGSNLFIFLKDPLDIEVLLTSIKHISKADSYKFTKQWLGNGLITAEGQTWHIHRKLLTPTFHFKILEQSLGIIHNNADIMIQQLKKEVGKEETNLYTYIEKCSTDMIGETAMGIKLQTQTSGDRTYLDAVKNVTDISRMRVFTIWIQPDILFRLSSWYKPYKAGLDIMENTSKQVINKRKKNLLEQHEKNNQRINEQSDNNDKKKPMPFLDMLLTESKFKDQEIHDEVQSFMFAGHDTTTSGISFCVYLLALHQDVQDKVYEEVMRVLPNKDVCPTVQELNSLRYLENVIKETLRLYPSVPMIGRELHEDVTLPSGYVLPEGCQVNINIFAVHRNKKLYDNPDDFIPERFDDENFKKQPFAYIPFSAGPRNCIGQKYAMMEAKVVLCSLLREYQLLPTEHTSCIRIRSQLILRSIDGIPVKILPRH